MILLGEKQIGYDSDNINRLSWNEFEELAELIAKDINNSSLGQMKVCLLGVARGGLPLLTYVSHHTGIRDVSIVQAKMTRSDNPFDYGKTKVFLEAQTSTEVAEKIDSFLDDKVEELLII